MLNNLNITMAQWTNNFIVPMAISAVVIAAYAALCTIFLCCILKPADSPRVTKSFSDEC